jgi:hypothetical protein
VITSAAGETYAWLQGLAPWYRPTRGDLALVSWWADVQRPGPAVIVQR